MFRYGAVSAILYIAHKQNRMSEPMLRAGRTMTFDTIYNRIDTRPECHIGGLRSNLQDKTSSS